MADRDAELARLSAEVAELKSKLAEIAFYVGSPYATEVNRIARRGWKEARPGSKY